MSCSSYTCGHRSSRSWKKSYSKNWNCRRCKRIYTRLTKLIKESNVDPLEIDPDVPSNYQPNNYSISDKEYELDRVLDDIKHTKTFDKTIDVLTKEWDAESKTTVSDNPEIIGVINTHMRNGIFDQFHKKRK